jgi:hypothetical protein
VFPVGEGVERKEDPGGVRVIAEVVGEAARREPFVYAAATDAGRTHLTACLRDRF